MEHVHQTTYALSPRPLETAGFGYEFEARYVLLIAVGS